MFHKSILQDDGRSPQENGKSLFVAFSAQLEAGKGIERLRLVEGHILDDDEFCAILWCANRLEEIAFYIPHRNSNIKTLWLVGCESHLIWIFDYLSQVYNWEGQKAYELNRPANEEGWQKWYRDTAKKLYGVLNGTTQTSELEELTGVFTGWANYIGWMDDLERTRNRDHRLCTGV